MGLMADADIGTMINKALETEIETYQWSTLFKTGIIWGIPDNSQGVVSLTNGQKRVIGYQTSFPVSPFPDYAPPENWVIVAGSQYMPLDVETFVSPTELLLREPWGDVTQTNVNFNLHPQFYSVPGANQVFLVRQILPVLPLSRRMLHLADPARLAGTSTPSVGHAEGGYDLQGNTRIELWLRPGGVEAYAIEYRERFKPLRSDNAWPQIPMNVIEPLAASFCCYSLYASKGDQTFYTLAKDYRAEYKDQRTKAIADDIERVVKTGAQGYHRGYEIETVIDQHGPPGPVFG